jgi:putative Mg2+ transporter-C (MgtC) family protein
MPFDNLLQTGALGPGELLARLALAVALGLAIGFDRELRDKPAGLRTHAMISLAACGFAILSIALAGEAATESGSKGADPTRALEAVATGVAFLGAGAIIQSRGDVYGITTGAGMWLAGAIGLACGGGFYFLAVVAAVFGIVLLATFDAIQRHVNGAKAGRDAGKPSARAAREPGAGGSGHR